MEYKSIKLIETYNDLEELSEILFKKKEIAVDFEAESNLHRYGVYLCLMQIADDENIYLIDPLKIKDLTPIKKVFETSTIQKIMFSADFDVRILFHSHKITIKNLYDLQISAHLLDYGKLSLKGFIISVLQKKAEDFLDCQTSDWNIRPLTEDQIFYAADDVRYLMLLKEKISEEIALRKLAPFIKIRNRELEKVRFNDPISPYFKVKNYHSLNKTGKKYMQKFYSVRDEIAQQRDLPPYKILSNDRLIQLSQKPLVTLEKMLKRFSKKRMWELEKFQKAYLEINK